MTYVDATYRGGVFQPDDDVPLQENQRVRLTIQPIQPIEPAEMLAWLERVKEHHRQILERRGGEPLPDSTPDIAEDRMRDA
jgi:predicted DNA-binding antitoxin AbrB/MazE fold protein